MHTKGHDDQTFVNQRSRAANVSFIKIKLLLSFFFFEDKLKYLFLLIFIRMWTRCGRCEMLGHVAMLLGHVVFW